MLASLKSILRRPALHITLTICFAAAFFWPIFAMTRPAQAFHFLYGGWFACLLALFAVSWGAPVETAGHADDDELDGELRLDGDAQLDQEAR